jgi:Ino eighty subunit 2
MTSRQAVLASVVDSSHVSLCKLSWSSFNTFVELTESAAESSRKKKQLTESEIALRREETARKRKNLSEKKLEDEKVCSDNYSCARLIISHAGGDYQSTTQETVKGEEQA